uniref:Interferon-induced GTP-binding protein Mx n=1 Tax=Amphiprion ocellaris TaxID=80972 RepID=A0AAQ5ZYD6_AMPOC
MSFSHCGLQRAAGHRLNSLTKFFFSSYFFSADTMNTLNQQYEEKVRPCIDLIDSLRSLGVEKDLALPAIAVIGDQSSGKSSVLEALSGVALPRGSGIVTRCPLELKMKRKEVGEKWFGKISYRNCVEEIKKPANVEEKIREAQDKMAGVGVGISDELISLEIASPDVPDLTLIDLPGIARVAMKGQPEDIGDQIKSLIQKFIKKQETISLVVVPCNVDIATTEALKMAQQVDRDGERTLGILTKPDLVDKGTEETVIEIVHNEAIHLKKGYMIVKCRGQMEISEKVSLTKAIEREKAFFKDHAYFQILYDEGHATVPKLAEKLTLELVHHIQKSLPRLEDQIKKKLKQTQVTLTRYGNGPPSDATERLGFLIDRVTTFTQDAINLIKGEQLKCGITKAWLVFLTSSKWLRYHLLCYLHLYTNFQNCCIFTDFFNKEAVAESMLRTQFQMEMIIYTQDTTYSKKLGKRKRVEEQNNAQKKSTHHLGFGLVIVNNDDSGASLKEMMNHLKSYFQIAGRRLADQIPLVIRYQILQESATQLQREMLQMPQDKEKMESLLQEDCGIKAKRTHLENRLQRLTKARILLTEFSMNIFNFSTTQMQMQCQA